MGTATVGSYTKGRVESADGTTIGYRRMGSGPAVVIVHGGMQAAQNFMGLATALSDEFEVFVPDRRGRGMSGPPGDRFGVMREVEDLQAVVAASGATRIFGLSSGALVTIRTVLNTPALTRAAVYEPPLSVNGSVRQDWVPRFEREVDEGKVAAALVTGLKGLGTEPAMRRIPRFVLAPVLRLPFMARTARPDDVSVFDLVPTLRFDMQIVREMADTAGDYAALAAEVLLLEGSKSPAFLHAAIAEFERVIPHGRRVRFEGLGHSGPDDDGDPKRVAAELRRFFR